MGLIYIIIVYKVWLYDTFLKYRPELEEAMVFWDNYRASSINENALLLTYGLVLWLKAFYQLKLLPFVGILYVVMTKVAKEMIIFGLFYFA